MKEYEDKIQIKGISDGLLISLGEGNWGLLETELLRVIAEKEQFFQGARVAIDVGNHILRASDIGALRDNLAAKSINVWAVLAGSPSTEMNAQMLGLSTRLSSLKPSSKALPVPVEKTPGEEAVLLQRTLRSGYKVDFGGHVVVLGDVNAGAEITAGGNVIVWGKLKGTVRAGVPGNPAAVVCALALEPALMRISNVPYLSQKRKTSVQPEIAKIEKNQVIITSWNPK